MIWWALLINSAIAAVIAVWVLLAVPQVQAAVESFIARLG